MPCSWIDEERQTIYWPQGVNANKALINQQHPDHKSWRKFHLLKVKISSDIFQECEDYQLTSTVEDTASNGSDDDYEGVLRRKRKRAKKILPEDFVSSQDLHMLQDVTPTKLKKGTSLSSLNKAPDPPQKLTPVSLQNKTAPSPSQTLSSRSSNGAFASRSSSATSASFPRSSSSDCDWSVDEHGSPRPGSSHDYKVYNHVPTKKLRHESHDSVDQLQQQSSCDQHEQHSSQPERHHQGHRHSSLDTQERYDRRDQRTHCSPSYSTDRNEGLHMQLQPKDHSFPMDTNRFQKRVLQLLLDAKEDMREMKQELRDLKSVNCVSSFSDSGIDLTIKRSNTLEEFQAVENELQNLT